MDSEAEYSSLRQEIIESGPRAIDVANFVVTITGTAIFAAFQFRNPYISLFPLFPLYYGSIVTFNITQTIARNSVYLRLFWENRRKEYHLETRLKELRMEVAREAEERRVKRPWIFRWMVPRSLAWERWMSPVLQTMFLVLGFVCIIIFGLIAWLMSSQTSTAQSTPTDLILDPLYNAIIFIVVSVIWSIVTIRRRHIGHPFYGKHNMIAQIEHMWLRSTTHSSESLDEHSNIILP